MLGKSHSFGCRASVSARACRGDPWESAVAMPPLGFGHNLVPLRVRREVLPWRTDGQTTVTRVAASGPSQRSGGGRRDGSAVRPGRTTGRRERGGRGGGSGGEAAGTFPRTVPGRHETAGQRG
nr:hypothetical protein KitaXyl93_56040 [Kitasatospora sp. Xyl93]